MKQKIKALWVAALRSGDYEQGIGQLRNENKFCCLGVLCDLHAQTHPKIAAKETNPNEYLGDTGYLPHKVME